MVAWTIRAAIESGLAEFVYVCTDDAEIESVAVAHGAQVFRIPESMAGDLVSSTVPCLELAAHLEAAGRRIDWLFNLQPTSPLRDARDIRNSLQYAIESQVDFLISVTPIDPHYFHWAVHERPEGWQMWFGKEFLRERPLLPPVHRPNGAIKLARLEKLRQEGTFFGKRMQAYQMPENRSIHVAEAFDLDCVRMLAARLQTSDGE